MFRIAAILFFLIQAVSFAGVPTPSEPSCKKILQSSTSANPISFRGIGILVGIMAMSAAVTTSLNVGVNSNSDFLPTFVGQVSLIIAGLTAGVTSNLSSGQMEKFWGVLRRFGYKLNPKANETDAAADLDSLSQRTYATYTLLALHSTDRIMTYRVALKQNMAAAARSMEYGDPEGAAAEFADALLLGYRLFREIDPKDPTILGTVHTSFRRLVPDSRALYEPTLSLLKNLDPDFQATPTRPQELSPQAYYERALQAWLLNPLPPPYSLPQESL